MTLDAIRDDIIAACREAQADGMRIVTGNWGDRLTCGCAVTAAFRQRYDGKARREPHYIEWFAQYCGIGCLSFMAGFDGLSSGLDPAIYALGQAVRKAVLG